MVGESPEGATDQTSLRRVEDELLLHAVGVLRRRYQEGDPYDELSPAAAAELGDVLAGVASAEEAPQGVDRDEALALAHRLMDDDHPELSPMWPRSDG